MMRLLWIIVAKANNKAPARVPQHVANLLISISSVSICLYTSIGGLSNQALFKVHSLLNTHPEADEGQIRSMSVGAPSCEVSLTSR